MLTSSYIFSLSSFYEPGKYFFQTKSGDGYEVMFVNKKNNSGHVIVSFNLTDNDDCYRLTNKGDVFKIIATVVSVVKKYMAENKNIYAVEFSGEHKTNENNSCVAQRTKVFQRYIPHVFSLKNWKVDTINNSVIISKRS